MGNYEYSLIFLSISLPQSFLLGYKKVTFLFNIDSFHFCLSSILKAFQYLLNGIFEIRFGLKRKRTRDVFGRIRLFKSLMDDMQS